MSQIIINCGLDEAGRGPLAGPVTAGAVILPPDFPLEILNDSKKISEKKRASAELVIKEKALSNENVKRHTEGKEIVKVIVIKNKIVNIVVKG